MPPGPAQRQRGGQHCNPLLAGTSQREPGPTDCCEVHSTPDEAAGYIAAAYAIDPELQESVRRQFSGENMLKHIENQAATQVITAQVLEKLRKK